MSMPPVHKDKETMGFWFKWNMSSSMENNAPLSLDFSQLIPENLINGSASKECLQTYTIQVSMLIMVSKHNRQLCKLCKI